jgi:hypothetical protein
MVKQLLAFLGVFNFYRRFVPAAAKILQPLTNSTWGSPWRRLSTLPGPLWGRLRCWHIRSKTKSWR